MLYCWLSLAWEKLTQQINLVFLWSCIVRYVHQGLVWTMSLVFENFMKHVFFKLINTLSWPEGGAEPLLNDELIYYGLGLLPTLFHIPTDLLSLLFSVKFGGHYGNCKDHPLFFLCICRSHFQLKFLYRESSLPVQACFWFRVKH